MNKLRVVQHLLNIVKFDLLDITKTHLNTNISDDWIRIPGYIFVRNDRDYRGGGGVLMYFKEDLVSLFVICGLCFTKSNTLCKFLREFTGVLKLR